MEAFSRIVWAAKVGASRSRRVDPDGRRIGAASAAATLKRIARNEDLKAYVLREPALHGVLLRAARRFIGGEELSECLEDAKAFNDEGFAVTLDYMGESTRHVRVAVEATREFERVISGIYEHDLDSSVSMDLSHVGLAVDEDLCYENAARLAGRAQEAGLEMMVSAEGSERTKQVLDMYYRLSESFENVGITLQAYLHDTTDTLIEALKRPGRIRLVKGAFEEPKSIAMPRGETADLAYRSCVEQILSTEHRCSIATHDPALLEDADRFVRENGLSRERVEFEMLKGVEEERLARMQDLGYRTRVYLPYGEEWYLYLCHRLAEHPPNIYRAIADATGGMPQT